MALLTAPSTKKQQLNIELNNHSHKAKCEGFLGIFGDFRSQFSYIYSGVQDWKRKYCPISLLSKNVNNFSVAHPRPELEPFPWRYYLTSNLFPVETGLDWTILSRYTVTTVQTAQSTHTSNTYLDHSRTIKKNNV